MGSLQQFVRDYMKSHETFFTDVSKYVYAHPETRFEEYKSAAYLADACEKAGFEVTRGVANIDTAFVASYGSGSPVIGFLGEFDALSGLGQEPLRTSEQPTTDFNGNGHGCGHNLLGTGSFAAACAAKEYMTLNNLEGTIQFFGCPGEEGGSGKTFMVREGVFDDVDLAFCWHPSPVNSIMSLSSLANYQVYFQFKGVASHAANSPHLGRSALDAVELMSSGVNYLREHVIPEARMHYAVTNTGGVSPNVVQAHAEVLYLIRAPFVSQVDEIYKRICKIAEGAALMTETEVTIRFDKACSNYIPNRSLERVLHKSLEEIGAEIPTEEESTFAQSIWESLRPAEKDGFIELMKGFGYEGDATEFKGKYLSDVISPYVSSDKVLAGSTDVADVSWVVPTAQLSAATSALGTPLHTWQMTSQGISSFAHKGMFRAGGSIALAAMKVLKDASLLQAVKEEFNAFKEENPYTNPIPDHIQPSRLTNE